MTDVHTSLDRLIAPTLPDLTEKARGRVVRTLVANGSVICEWFREQEQGPDRVKLRQQRGLELDNQDAWVEEAKEAHDRYHYALGVLRALGSPHVDRFDVDERDAAGEDRRDTERAQDEAADRQAVRP